MCSMFRLCAASEIIYKESREKLLQTELEQTRKMERHSNATVEGGYSRIVPNLIGKREQEDIIHSGLPQVI
jgi:hypothetical protein